MQAPPALVGDLDWTRATLGASGHLAQVYGELKRCHKARRARLLLREELCSYIAWKRGDAAAISPIRELAPALVLG